MLTIKRSDIIISLVIGEVAGLLMLAIGRGLPLPSGLSPLLPWMPFAFPLLTLVAIFTGTIIGRRIGVAYQFTKFALIGGTNFLVDLGTLNLLIGATGITGGFFAAVFKATAFLVAVIFSFTGNKFWTFRALSVEQAGRQFFWFFVVSAVGLAMNVGTFALVNDAIGAPGGITDQLWANVSAVGASVVVLLWNFLGYKFFVFRRIHR